MARASTHVKLGLLAVLGAVAAVVTALGLGARSLRGEATELHTYFDESVAGLEIGAPVKYRGIQVGTVGAIVLAPDRRHVDVTLELRADDVHRVGLATTPPGSRLQVDLSDEVRAQLGTQGITGVKYVALDFAPPSAGPPPALPFVPAADHVAAGPSFMKTLEDSMSETVVRLPELAETTLATMRGIEMLVEDVRGAALPEHARDTLHGVDGAVQDLRRVLRDVDRARIPEKTAATIDSIQQAAARLDAILTRLDGDAGLVASTQRATDAVGDLGRSASGSTAELDRTLRDLGEAAQAIRELAESLEREPDMLLHGRPAPAAP
jgi:phospholipid/cholesterol/gamma-HCH transport system substrate-binding protein